MTEQELAAEASKEMNQMPPYIELLLEKQVRLIYRVVDEKAPSFVFDQIKRGEKELALYFSNYCCEGCGTEEALTLHHFVMKPTRTVLSFKKYFQRRHDLENIVVLCLSCHRKSEGRTRPASIEYTKNTIPKKDIEKFKKKANFTKIILYKT